MNSHEQLLINIKEAKHTNHYCENNKPWMNGTTSNGHSPGISRLSPPLSPTDARGVLRSIMSYISARKALSLAVLGAVILLFMLIHVIVYVSKMQVAVYGQSVVCKECEHTGMADQPFPKILHHTWKNNTIPDKWKNSTAACRRLNANYKYMFWTDKDIENLLQTHYPWFMKTYKGYTYNIQRADAGRYFILYHYGGVYTDLDIMCRYPFDKILENVTQYDIVFPQGPPIGITAEIMVAKPRHPYLNLAIHSLSAADKWRVFPYATIIFSTGPMFMSNVLMEYDHKDQFYIIPYDIYTQDLFINLHGGSWHEWDGDFIFWVYTHKLMLFVIITPLVVGLVYMCKNHRHKLWSPTANGYHYTKLYKT